MGGTPHVSQWCKVCIQMLLTLGHTVIRAGDRTGQFLYIKEGMMQGYPLEIVAYGLGFHTIIRELRTSHRRVKHTWYADYAGVRVTFEIIRCHLDNLML